MPSDAIDFDQSDYWNVFTDAPGGLPEKWERPVLSLVALAIVSFGIKNSSDIYFATAAQFAFWICGHKGPAAMYSALAGLQFGRNQYKFAAFPTLLDSYYAITDFSTKKSISYAHTMATIAWFMGFFLAKYRYI